jgi:predicted metal-binding membrane protein
MTATAPARARRAQLDPTSVVVLGLAATAWSGMIAIAASPWAGSFSHSALETIGARPWEVATLAVGWVLMVVATMLPTIVPLVSLFGRMTARRDDRRRLRALLLAGYAGVWLAAGLAMHGGDLGVHRLVHHWSWLAANTWAIDAVTLGAAAAYEASGVKARCLRRCRAPRSFIRRRWSGGSEARQALSIGFDHGVYCLGCCWALMLVMFSVGVSNVLWMLALTAVMVVEKTSPSGMRARAPVAIWLLTGALLAVIVR